MLLQFQRQIGEIVFICRIIVIFKSIFLWSLVWRMFRKTLSDSSMEKEVTQHFEGLKISVNIKVKNTNRGAEE